MTRSERRETMLAHVAAWQQSGKSRKEYCTARGIALQTFHSWCQRTKVPEGLVGFAPVEVAAEHAVELHYPNGVRLVLPAGAALTHIAACVKLY